MENINNMKYKELLDLKERIDARVAKFRPVRLREKWRRCGKKGCFCKDGPADGSWGNLHGPYVFAQFVDHETKKTKSVSLGRLYGQDNIMEVSGLFLEWWKFFKVPSPAYDKLPARKKEDYPCRYYLTGEDFRNFYGLDRQEDALARATEFYGTFANRDALDAATENLSERKAAVTHRWCNEYGIGSVGGQKVLSEILKRDYYLAE